MLLHAAVVLDLELELGVGRAVGVGRRDELRLPPAMLARRDGVARGDPLAVQGQRARIGERRDPDAAELVGRRVVRVEAGGAVEEVARQERVGVVFLGRDGLIRRERARRSR